jgi:hypothetical protein
MTNPERLGTQVRGESRSIVPSQNRMILLSIYNLFAGIAPWLALISGPLVIRAICYGNDPHPQFTEAGLEHLTNCIAPLFALAIMFLPFTLACTVVIGSMIVFTRWKTLPKRYIAFSTLGYLSSAAFLVGFALLIMLFSALSD